MKIPESILVQWIIIFGLVAYFAVVGRKIKDNPQGHQNFWEMVVERAGDFIQKNMGDRFKFLVEYFLILGLFIFACNMTGLLGIKNPTADFSLCLTLGLINFALIQYCAIRKNGLGSYFKGFLSPMAGMLPLNIMERVLFPVSLSLRLFGNVFAAYMILDIVYKGLIKISPILAIGIPIPLHMYFDLFDGTLQVMILVLLSMINIKIISEH